MSNKYIVTIDGQKYTVNSPTELTDEQAYQAVTEQMSKMTVEKTDAPAESQLIRTALQGATFGFGDEIEAMISAAIPGGPSYEDRRDEIRSKLKAYEKQNTGKAMTAEMAGAVIPSILMTMTGVGGPGAVANFGRILGINTAQSAAESVGKSDADTTAGQALQIGAGTGTGAVVGTALELLMGRMGDSGKKVYNALRKRYGSGYDNAIQEYLLTILESTDLKSVDDVITAVKNGDVIGDNPVLTNEIKAMVNAGGNTANTALSLSAKRAADTEERAVAGLNNALDPDGQNVDLFARVMDAEKQDLDEIGDAYSATYGDFPKVPNIIAVKMQGILQKNPEARSVLKKIYDNDPSTSALFKVTKDKDTGADVVTMLREPNLKDAERLRRRMDTMTSKQFDSPSGDPDLGDQYRRVEQTLRTDIDNFSPELEAIRANYAATKSNAAAFNEGSMRGLSGKPDVNAYNMRDMSAEQLEAYRQGTLHSFNSQKRATGANLAALAREGDNLNKNIQQILPTDQADQVMGNVRTAANARKMNQAIQPTAGSPTQGLQAASRRLEQGPSVSGLDVVDATRGSVPAMIGIVSDVLGSFFQGKKGYTDAQTKRIAEILFSSDPEFVTEALKDRTNWGLIAERADQIAPYVMRSAQTAVTQQAAAAPVGLLSD